MLAGLGGAAGTVLGYNTQFDLALGAGLVAMLGAFAGWFVVAMTDCVSGSSESLRLNAILD